MQEIKAPKRMPMVRKNTRITQKQDKHIKARAKKENATEGDIFRAIIDKDMKIKNK